MVVSVRYLPGAKLLLTKACAYGPKKELMCEELILLPDISRMLLSPTTGYAISNHGFMIASTVITFVEKDETYTLDSFEPYSECYIVGDSTVSIRLRFPDKKRVPPNPEGCTYIVFSIAVVAIRGKIYLEVLKDTRLLPCSEESGTNVCPNNEVS